MGKLIEDLLQTIVHSCMKALLLGGVRRGVYLLEYALKQGTELCANSYIISISLTKHIEIDRLFIKEELDSGLISAAYVPMGLS